MLKKLITLILIVSFAKAISFDDFSSVADVSGLNSDSIGKTIGTYATSSSSSFSNGFSSIKDTFSNKAMSSVTSVILNKSGGALNSSVGGVLSYCYDYKPSPVKNFDFSFDPCNLFGNSSLSPCDSAPNLEKLGYYKKSDVSQLSFDFNRYCNKLINSNETTTQVVKSVNTSKTIDKTIVNNNDKVENKISDSAIGLEKGLSNIDVKKAIETNNYKTYTVMKDVVKRADDNVDEIDFTNINVEYKTLEEYEESVESLANDYTQSKNNINLDKLKRESYEQFVRVNADTSDENEREKQKEALKSKILEDYKNLLDKFEKYEIDKTTWLLTNENKQVVYPTANVVKGAATTEEKINMIYYIEKQKKEKANMITIVKSQTFNTYEQAKKVIEVSYLKSIEFNREKEYNAIMEKLNSLGGN